MSDLGDLGEAIQLGSDPLDVFGFQAADAAEEAAREAAAIQTAAGERAIAEARAATERGLEFFEPFSGAAERGIEGSSFLTDPQERFDFLQNNPLFNLSLENANQRTLQGASANRRLSFGDTLQQLSNNVLLASQPLLATQDRNLTNLLNFGGDVATSQANIATGQEARIGNLTTDIGGVNASALIAGSNAQQAASQNFGDAAITAGSIFLSSDERLKTNKKIIGKLGEFNRWSWDWNELAGQLFGLFGSDEGVMAQEVMLKKPSAVINQDGFYRVNYGEL